MNSIGKKQQELVVPVVICVYKRIERLSQTLLNLKNQVGCSILIYIWNNSPDQKKEINNIISKFPEMTIKVRHSKDNIGGFGRFYFAREIDPKYEKVVFIDDDVNLANDVILTLANEFKPHSIHSFYSFCFLTSNDYFERFKPLPFQQADYCGTGGMICDISIFQDEELFECPKDYWFIEDLWLCYYASFIKKWELKPSRAKITLIEDGKNQWVGLSSKKTIFLKYLVAKGWKVAENQTFTKRAFNKFVALSQKLGNLIVHN
jgi:hypothetical protein